MKKALLILVLVIAVAMFAGCSSNKPSPTSTTSTGDPPAAIGGVEPIAWYGPMPHPYVTEVKSGVEAYAKDNKTQILHACGPAMDPGQRERQRRGSVDQGPQGVQHLSRRSGRGQRPVRPAQEPRPDRRGLRRGAGPAHARPVHRGHGHQGRGHDRRARS